jgi:hypothetical protein
VYDRTYSEQYVWAVALSGQEGMLPAVLLLLWLLFVMGQVLAGCMQLLTSRIDAVGINNKGKGCCGASCFRKELHDRRWARLWNWRNGCALMLIAA